MASRGAGAAVVARAAQVGAPCGLLLIRMTRVRSAAEARAAPAALSLPASYEP